MKNEMAFVGIGMEAGQNHEGLALSSRFARNFLRTQIGFSDFGDIVSKENKQEIRQASDFSKIGIGFYEKAAKVITSALQSHTFTLNWGGDHSVALSTVSAFLNVYPEGKVIWIDAHADLNKPETSPTGNFHGMPVSFLLGLNSLSIPGLLRPRLKPEQLIYVGLRSLDPYEITAIRELGISNFDMSYIRRHGIQQVIQEILALVGQAPTHISFDIDSLDPKIAPSTGVPVTEGLTFEEAQALSQILSKKVNFKSLDIVEINPLLGSFLDVELTYNVAFSFLKNFLPIKGANDVIGISANQRKFPTAPKWGVSLPS